MRSTAAPLLVLSLLLAVLPPALAQDRRLPSASELGSLPIEISADRMNADNARNVVTFEGNVHAKQGDVTMQCDRLTAEYARPSDAIEKISAVGSVRVLQKDREAKAPRADFFNMEQRIVLTGGAELRQGENTLRGETVTIYLRENRTVVTGGSSGRVNAVISPKGGLAPRGTEKR